MQRRAALDGEAIAAASKASFDEALAAEAALRQGVRHPGCQQHATLCLPFPVNRMGYFKVEIYLSKR